MTLAELLVKIKTDKGNTDTQINSVGKSLKDLNILGIASVAVIGTVLVKAFKSCVSAAAESELVVSKLNAVLKATGGISGVTSESAQELAKSLQQVTAFDDEAIMSGETLLLTFRNIGQNIFPQATEAALDLATVMGGDVTGAARLLGKALDNPSQGMAALQRMGVRLSDSQKEQVNTFMALNNVAAAQKVVMDALAAKMGGAAKAAADTYDGRMKNLKNNISELAETIGNALLPILNEIIPRLNTAIKGLTEFLNIPTSSKDKIKILTEDLKKQEAVIDKYSNKKFNPVEGFFMSEQDRLDTLAKAYATKTKIQADIDRLSKAPITIKGGAKPVTEDTGEYKKAKEDLLKIEQDYETKLAQLNKDGLTAINAQEFQAWQDLKATKLANTTEAEAAKTNIAKYYTDLRAEYEKQKMLETANMAINSMSQITSGLSGIFNQYMTNKNMELDNDLYVGNERITAEYEAEKARIENTVTDEREKAAQLKALDEKKSRDEQALQKKIEKEKRKMQREAAQYSKAISITDATIKTAQAIVSALAMSGPPWVGIIMAAIVGAMGAAQVALIASQPLPAAAEGMVANRPAIFGEAGLEMAVPLAGEQGRSAIREFASGILDVMSQQVDNRATISNGSASAGGGGGNVYLDGSLVGTWLQSASNNGQFYINQKVVVS